MTKQAAPTQICRQRMRADYRVILDACTLAPANLCEILLRLGETPRLYSPQWSEHILTEVRRTHIEKLNWPEKLADFWQQEVRQSFPEALVTGYEPLIAVCDINEKDKHVLAAAIKARAELIVTTNIRHFPLQDLDPWGIEVAHPANYLITLYSIDPGVVVSKIDAIANNRGITPQSFLSRLGRTVPSFARHVADSLGYTLNTD